MELVLDNFSKLLGISLVQINCLARITVLSYDIKRVIDIGFGRYELP